MKIICNPAEIGDVVLAIGNFDGLHLGHKGILQKAQEVAVASNLPLAVMTFEPHPRKFFQGAAAPKRISGFKEKMQLLAMQGVEICYVLKFNASFSQRSAQDFYDNFLANAHVVTGMDFCFGHKRGGDVKFLTEHVGEKYHMVHALKMDEEAISSSRIREALQNGGIELANKLLGHEFYVEGKVLRGAGDAAKLGYPTANLRFNNGHIKPKYGVYAVQTFDGENVGKGIANFGVRPTLDGKTELLEVHIFDFVGDLYGKNLHVQFQRYIREEMHFENFAALKAQIEIDVKKVKENA